MDEAPWEADDRTIGAALIVTMQDINAHPEAYPKDLAQTFFAAAEKAFERSVADPDGGVVIELTDELKNAWIGLLEHETK